MSETLSGAFTQFYTIRSFTRYEEQPQRLAAEAAPKGCAEAHPQSLPAQAADVRQQGICWAAIWATRDDGFRGGACRPGEAVQARFQPPALRSALPPSNLEKYIMRWVSILAARQDMALRAAAPARPGCR